MELAIEGGPAAFGHETPRYPSFSAAILERLVQVISTGPTQGLSKHHPVVGEFERALAEFHEVPHCLSASSGHGALQSALIGLEIADGDHVITSPYSWGASVSCILHNGAVPVFCDVSAETGLIDPGSLERALTPHTRAVLVPHLYGQVSDMTAILDFADRHGLAVIEDGSQAHGARHRGRRLGSLGDAAGFSINGVKPLATTEGGYLVTRHESVYWTPTISAQHAGRGELIGRASEPGFPDDLRDLVDTLVYTYRPNLASLILALDQLPHVDELNANRRGNAEALRKKIDDLDLFSMPAYPADDTPVYHMVTINVRVPEWRDAILGALQAEGVPAVTYVARGLNESPRLSPSYAGPKVMWTGTVRRSGYDATAADLPGMRTKVAASIEIPWNYVEENEDLTTDLALAFAKIQANPGALRRLAS
ncbi:DegT/DnrJ/EryC1/StrS family aminotransferase [Jiangella muralis]|uniref:DegT/DnrJ/EryC1/StrS family aminotransferase n=1 Tax=Jiangella muralis TaxID=702383 RepID=UPI001F0B33B2|nr:aminotransferase class I/II-fold pyridoxal phosphate-dependent enzyme [Jiangella muralis]